MPESRCYKDFLGPVAGDPNSLLNWHRRMIALRRAHPAVHSSSCEIIDTSEAAVLEMWRDDGEGRVTVLLNFGTTAAVAQVAGMPPVELGPYAYRWLEQADAAWRQLAPPARNKPPPGRTSELLESFER